MKPVPLATPYHSQTKTHKTDHQFFIFSLREVYIHPALPESRIESSDKYSFALSHNTVLDKLKILSKLLVESRPRVYPPPPPPHTHTHIHAYTSYASLTPTYTSGGIAVDWAAERVTTLASRMSYTSQHCRINARASEREIDSASYDKWIATTPCSVRFFLPFAFFVDPRATRCWSTPAATTRGKRVCVVYVRETNELFRRWEKEWEKKRN